MNRALRQIRNLLVLILFCGGLGYFIYRGGNFSNRPPVGPQVLYDDASTAQFLSNCGPPALDRKPVAITMVTSADKEPWLRAAATRFGHLCPNIQLRVSSTEDITAARTIATGELAPTLWAPSSDLALYYAEHLRQRSKQKPIFEIKQSRSLLASPLVWLLTEERYAVLKDLLSATPRPEGMWMQLGCAMVPRTAAQPADGDAQPKRGRWIDLYKAAHPQPSLQVPETPPAKQEAARKQTRALDLQPPPAPPVDPRLAELEPWGSVRFGHPDPLRSQAGLDTLVLLAYDFVLPPAVRTTPDADLAALTRGIAEQRAALRDWLSRCEAPVQDFAPSDQALVTGLSQFGNDRYDIVATQEHAALSSLASLQQHAIPPKSFRLVYPEPTRWSTHPVVMLNPSDSRRREEHAAAAKWLAYLLTDSVQQAAIEQGFRPGRPEISIRDYPSESNPFLRSKKLGVELKTVRPGPQRLDGELLTELMNIWSEATAR